MDQMKDLNLIQFSFLPTWKISLLNSSLKVKYKLETMETNDRAHFS